MAKKKNQGPGSLLALAPLLLLAFVFSSPTYLLPRDRCDNILRLHPTARTTMLKFENGLVFPVCLGRLLTLTGLSKWTVSPRC